jgi:hypothetical protein
MRQRILRKRPCRVCRRWFRPDPRQKERQYVCGDEDCQRELSPREEVIQILAEGLWDLVVSGRRPDRHRRSPVATKGTENL